MGNPAGVKRDFEALEKRRMQAIRLLEKNDLKQSEVARRLHVCRQTVSRWADEFKAGGKPALQKGRSRRAQAAVESGGAGTPGRVVSEGTGTVGLRDPAVDLCSGGPPDSGQVRSRVSPGPCLETAYGSGLELSAAHGTGARAQGRRDPALATRALACH